MSDGSDCLDKFSRKNPSALFADLFIFSTCSFQFISFVCNCHTIIQLTLAAGTKSGRDSLKMSHITSAGDALFATIGDNNNNNNI